MVYLNLLRTKIKTEIRSRLFKWLFFSSLILSYKKIKIISSSIQQRKTNYSITLNTFCSFQLFLSSFYFSIKIADWKEGVSKSQSRRNVLRIIKQTECAFGIQRRCFYFVLLTPIVLLKKKGVIIFYFLGRISCLIHPQSVILSPNTSDGSPSGLGFISFCLHIDTKM